MCATERGGRVHTSIVSVAVLPVRTESEFKLNLKDVEIQVTKGSGPGGQARNKLETAIRAIHKPTGLKAFICNERSQHQNKEMALKILSAKVEDFYRQKDEIWYNGQRLAQVGNRQRSDKVRTYNFCKSRVVDHRLGTKTTRIDEVMNGRFDLILK